MKDLRCRCGKILCQIEGEAVRAEERSEEANVIFIKCRHCKRYMAIHIRGGLRVEYVEEHTQVAAPAGR
jgi:phage FluMu protein Com